MKMMRPTKQFFMLIEGPMGAGKTTVAGLLKERLANTIVLGLDEIKWFQSDFVRSDEANFKVEEVIYAMTKVYIRQGFNVIIDHGFWKTSLRAKYRKAYLRYAKNKGLKIFIYHFTTPTEVSFDRVAKRNRKPKAHDPNRPERIRRNINEHEKRRFRGGYEFDTTKHSALQIAKLILRDII